MTDIQDEKLLRLIDGRIGIDSIKKFERIDIGYSNLVFNINDKYILKVCIKPDNEAPIINEIKFYESSSFDFHPKLISYDTSKTIIPNIFVLQEKVDGVNLSNIWGKLSETERQEVIAKITIVLKNLHNVKTRYPEFDKDFNATIEKYISELTKAGSFTSKELNYLSSLSTVFKNYFTDVDFSFIHGDAHFNNIMYDGNKIKILDFEYSSVSPVDREFDAINRMCQDPLSVVQKGNQNQINPNDYKNIMRYFKEIYPEVFENENFNERLLIYNCANALRWSLLYPNFPLYRDILFEKSKVLFKK